VLLFLIRVVDLLAVFNNRRATWHNVLLCNGVQRLQTWGSGGDFILNTPFPIFAWHYSLELSWKLSKAEKFPFLRRVVNGFGF
jgi:hypothetical protein